MGKKENEREYWLERKERDEKRIESIKSELSDMDIKREGNAVVDVESFNKYYGDLTAELEELEQDVKLAESKIDKEKTFDKQKFLKNFRYLLNKSEVKIGDIEREAGVTAGYVSRLESGKIAADPSVEFVLTAARLLNVSVERLADGDFDELSPTESYISKVLNSLIEDTQADRITWYKESEWELECIGFSSVGDTEHPLFRATFDANGPTGTEYYSHFLNVDEIKPAGNFYHAILPNTNSKIYISRIKENLFGEELESLELYLIDRRNQVKPVCADSVCCERLKKELKELYKEIELSSSHLHIEDDVRNILDAYMEELPFY